MNEANYTATIRETSPLHSRSSSSCSTKSSAGRGLTASLASGRKSGFSGTPWSMLSTTWCLFRFSMLLCRFCKNSWWTSSPSWRNRRRNKRRGWIGSRT